MIDRFERFVLSISEIYRCWHKIAATEMENYGLRGPHVVYLTTLSNHPVQARLIEFPIIRKG